MGLKAAGRSGKCELWTQELPADFIALQFICPSLFVKPLNLPEPQFLHRCNGEDNTFLVALL